jgi:autotransporter-associated beta strand protein
LQRQTRIGGAGGITLTGTITGGGFNLIKDSVSTLTLSNSGTVALGALQSNRGTIQVDPGTTLNVTSIDIGIGNSVGAGLTLNGGSVTSSGTSRFGQGAGTASGTLTLNSGTLTVPALTKGSLTFNANFNGGTLKAKSASSSFLTATAANVKDGGAIIDSNSFDITIPQALLRFTGATTDKLTKNGNGFLTLSGTNTYGGGTDVTAGGVTYLNTNAKPTAGTTTVATNATLGLGVATTGTFFTSTDVDSLFAGTLAGVTNSATSNVGIDTAAASFTYSSSIPANTKGLVKLGANTLTLNGTNAYTGGTSVNGGTLILLGDQSAATGGISGTSTVQTTISIGSAAQTSVTTAAVASGKTVSFGNSGGFVFQYLNVSGASGFPTTVTNNGSMSLGRFGEVNINAYGNWIQNGDLTIQPNGGTYADFLLKANGTVTYGGVNPINITTSLSGTGNAWLSIAGTFTTSQGFNLNSNTVATYYPYMILTGGTGTLKLSANVAQLINTTGTGGITGNLQLGTGGGTIDTNGFSTAIGANIVDVAAQTGSLTKAGSGTLTLSDTNNYTGTTTVAAGTLEVTGSLGATAVTVQNNATLAGNGNLGGNVTIQTGGHHALAVAATTGAQVTRTITGALDLTAVGNILDLTAASTPAPGGPYVLVTATGGITGAPTTVNLSGLAGTVAVNGNNLELTVTAPPAGYTSWIDGFGLAAADKDPLDDPDNDGMANALEYVLNATPSVSDPSKLPTLSVTGADFVFSFTRREESAADTTQVFQYGSNLAGWTSLNITTPTASEVALGTPSGGLQSVIVTIPKTLASGGKLFGRLQVVK